MIILIIPLLISISIIITFLTLFRNLDWDDPRINSKYVLISLFIIATIYYSSLFLWFNYNLKVIGDFGFNCIIIGAGLVTALMYAIINTRKLNKIIHLLVFTVSILPWFIIPVIATPYFGQIILHELVEPTLGLGKVTIIESEKYRLDEVGSVPTSGGQKYYHFVAKHMFYEKVVKTHGYPKEVIEIYKDYF